MTDVDQPSDREIRIRCVEAANRAMMRGPAQGETASQFAADLLGLGNAFYGLAIKEDPTIALRAIEAAAIGMVNAKLPGQRSNAFAVDVFTVATQACKFSLGQVASMGEPPTIDSLLKRQG